MRFLEPGSDDQLALRALTEELVDHEHEITGELVYATDRGIFTRAELADAQAEVVPAIGTTATGRRGFRIRFPSLWPWRRRPDKERGEPGERGDPVYADGPEQRHLYANRRAEPTQRRGVTDAW